jgi:hypothetical protein
VSPGVVNRNDDQRFDLALSDQAIGRLVHLPLFGTKNGSANVEDILAVIQVENRVLCLHILLITVALGQKYPEFPCIVENRAVEVSNFKVARGCGSALVRSRAFIALSQCRHNQG